MAEDAPGTVTRLLDAIRAGDPSAQERLFHLVSAKLHERAASLMRHERPDHTLQPTALVNEACIRLLEQDALRESSDRRYLFGAAARAMRQILVEHARQRKTAKRDGGRRVPLDSLLDYYERQKVDVLALNEALENLAIKHERPSQVLTLRYFGGFSVAEVAEQLEVSVTTVEREFRFARAWLHRHLKESA